MATVRQRKLAEAIIENSTLDKPLNAGQMLEKVGYSKNVASAKSADIINSEGVQSTLQEYGFNEDNAKRVVTDILLDEKKDANVRLKASDMVFKVYGTYAAEKKQMVNLNVEADITDNKELDTIRKEFEDKLKGKLIANE